MSKPPYGNIADSLMTGSVVPFLGPGANFGKRTPGEQWTVDSPFTPSGYELSKFLAERTNFPSDGYAELADLTKVASYFVDQNGTRMLRKYLRSVFDKEYEPCDIHTYISQIPQPLLVVTANYDDLLEKSFTQVGRPFDVVYTLTDKPEHAGAVAWWKHEGDHPVVTSARDVSIDLERTSVIYKIRGTCMRPANSTEWDSYVITEDDHIDFIVRQANGLAIPECFMRYFSERHFLFVGQGLRDWDMRLLIKQLTGMQGDSRPRSWAIQFRPSSLEVETWRQRGVNIYDADINEFTRMLKETESQLVNRVFDTLDTTAQEAAPTIFISYAREDEDRAMAVYNLLIGSGFRPWLDKKEILPGQRWDAEITESLKKSDFLIICMSKNSLSKNGYVRKEMRMALDEAKKMPRESIYIIPIRFDECDVPAELAEFEYVNWPQAKGTNNLIRAISFEWHRRSSTSPPD